MIDWDRSNPTDPILHDRYGQSSFYDVKKTYTSALADANFNDISTQHWLIPVILDIFSLCTMNVRYTVSNYRAPQLR